MNRDELVEAGAQALRDTFTDYKPDVADVGVVVDATLPMITEAIAADFAERAARLDAQVKTSGYALGVEVERERDHALRAARYIRGWTPTDGSGDGPATD